MRNPFKKKPALAPALSEEQQKTLNELESRLALIGKSAPSAEKLTQLEELRASIDGINLSEDVRMLKKYEAKDKPLSMGGIGLGVCTVIGALALHMTPVGFVSLPLVIGGAVAGRRRGLKAYGKGLAEAAPFHGALLDLKARAATLSEDVLKADPTLVMQSKAAKELLQNAPDLAAHFSTLAARPAPPVPLPDKTADTPPKLAGGKFSL